MFTYPIMGTAGDSPYAGLLVDLVSWWSLDETTGNRLDSYGSNDLTDSGSTGGATGKIDGCADFAGSTYLYSPPSPGLNSGDNDWSAAFWINRSNVSQYAICLTYGTPGGTGVSSYNFTIDLNTSNIINAYVAVTGTWYGGASSFGALSHSTWYLIYVEYDSTNNNVGISVNNGPLTTYPVTGTPNAIGSTPTLIVGAQRTGFYHLNGRIDNMAVWNRLLSDDLSYFWNDGNGIAFADI